MIISVKKKKRKEGILRVFSFYGEWSCKASPRRDQMSRDSGASEQLSEADGGKNIPGGRNNKYKDTKGRKYFSLGMTKKPVWLEQGLRKRAEIFPKKSLTGPSPMVRTMDYGELGVKWEAMRDYC